MKKAIQSLTFSLLIGAVLFSSCNSGSASDNSAIATDSVSIALGEKTFIQNCSSCHNFIQDGIGPQLGGLTDEAPAKWIKQFIHDPKTMIGSGDERAQQLFNKYHVMMPSFADYPEEELDRIIAYLHTQKAPAKSAAGTGVGVLANPIPEPIGLSDMVLALEPVTQIPPSSTKLPMTRIAKLDVQPNSQDLFVLDLRGKLYKLVNNQPHVYLDMSKMKPNFINEPGLATGFGSFAFHPEFAKNGLLYTTHTEPANTAIADFRFQDSIKPALQWVLTEWKTDQPGQTKFSGKSRELFRVNMVSGVHGMQEITFNPLAKPGGEDYGLLYIGIGDGGSADYGFPFIPHHLNSIWGTIIRIDPKGKNSVNGRYGIPESNPFSKTGDPKTVREIYAYGFRNPHRITWSKTGQIMASNIGGGNVESVNFIFPGGDYGWPVREGAFVLRPSEDMTKVYPLPADDSVNRFTYPVIEYDHDEGNAISAGFEYWGSIVPELKGKFVFGDIVKGRLFYSNMADLKPGRPALVKEWQVSLNGKLISLPKLCGSDRVDLRFGKDQNGEIYLLTKPDGKVYRLTSAKTI